MLEGSVEEDLSHMKKQKTCRTFMNTMFHRKKMIQEHSD